MSKYAKERNVKCAFRVKKLMILLMDKKTYFNETNLNYSLPSIVVSLLCEIKDVLLNEMLLVYFLPRELSIKLILCQIEVSNPMETKELQMQVNELLERGMLKKVCAVPILLVAKIDLDLENV